MIEKLIKFFETQKANKMLKFSNNLSNVLTDEHEKMRIQNLLNTYKNNVFALLYLAPYIDVQVSHKYRSYISMVIFYLKYLKDENIELSKEDEEKIRSDECVVSSLERLKAQLENNTEDTFFYKPVYEEVKKIDGILECLYAIEPDDYIDESVINLIYDYLMNENYIKYEDKFVNVGKWIATYNIDIANKRTKM